MYLICNLIPKAILFFQHHEYCPVSFEHILVLILLKVHRLVIKSILFNVQAPVPNFIPRYKQITPINADTYVQSK
jgi:hypothetical protein